MFYCSIDAELDIIHNFYYRYSSCKAFKLVMNEINDLAGQHEVIAENLQSNVIEELTMLVKDIREDRKV